ncbi:WD40-repeat-containing domain protein [Fomes fomentarius]|nr:WD40-repeat-containing domain protein [Fomes fomentarius]
MSQSSVETLDIDVMSTNGLSIGFLRHTMSSCQDVFDTVVATLDILSRPLDSLHSLKLMLRESYGSCSNYDRAVRQASAILDRIPHPPKIAGSMKRECTITFRSLIAVNEAIEACRNLEESILRCSPHCHTQFQYPSQRTRWLLWDRTMSTLFPVLYTKNMLNLESCGVDVKRPLARYGHGSSVTALAVTPDGLWTASGASDGSIILWSMVDRNLSPVLHWGAHTQEITQLQFSPDGRHLASGSDSEVHIWDAIDGTPLATLPLTTVASKTYDDTHSDPNGFQPYRFASMVWSPVGTIIAYSAGILRWWDTNTFNSVLYHPSLAQSSNGPTPSTLIPSKGSCRLIQSTPHLEWVSALSSDGGRLVTMHRDESVLIWNISELENIPPFHKLSLPSDEKSPAIYHSLDISGTGREVLCRTPGTSVEIWDAHTDTQIASLEHDNEVSTACISHCGQFVATHICGTAVLVYLWRVSDSTCLGTFKVNRCDSKMFFTPDGQTLVYGTRRTVFCRPIGHLLTMEGNTD